MRQTEISRYATQTETLHFFSPPHNEFKLRLCVDCRSYSLRGTIQERLFLCLAQAACCNRILLRTLKSHSEFEWSFTEELNALSKKGLSSDDPKTDFKKKSFYILAHFRYINWIAVIEIQSVNDTKKK